MKCYRIVQNLSSIIYENLKFKILDKLSKKRSQRRIFYLKIDNHNIDCHRTTAISLKTSEKNLIYHTYYNPRSMILDKLSKRHWRFRGRSVIQESLFAEAVPEGLAGRKKKPEAFPGCQHNLRRRKQFRESPGGSLSSRLHTTIVMSLLSRRRRLGRRISLPEPTVPRSKHTQG